MSIRNFVAGTVALLMLLATAAKGEVVRKVTPLSEGWLFSEGSASKIQRDLKDYSSASFQDNDWRQISLPHDFTVDLPYSETGEKCVGWDYFYQSVGWYRRHINLDAAATTHNVRLILENVSQHCEVWCNGKYIGHGTENSSVSLFDLTGTIVEGDNLICAMVNGTAVDPTRDDGDGLCGEATLLETGSWCIAPQGVSYSARFHGSRADITVDTRVECNDPEGEDYVGIRHMILDGNGLQVADCETSLEYLTAYTTGTISHTLSIPYAARWDLNVPYRYTLRTVMTLNGEVVDQMDSPLALRELYYNLEESTALLNGRRLEMKICRLPSYSRAAGFGVARNFWEFIIAEHKDAGYNVLILRDPAPSLLDVCDKLGVFVIDECSLPDIAVPRDGNHPCLAGWKAPEGVESGRIEAHIAKLDSRPIYRGAEPGSAVITVADPINKKDPIEVGIIASKKQVLNDGEDIVVLDIFLKDRNGKIVTERDRNLFIYVDTSLNTAFGINTDDPRNASIDYELSPIHIIGFSNDDPAFHTKVRDDILKTVLEISTYKGRARVVLRSVKGATGHAHVRAGGTDILGSTLNLDYLPE